jgi:hypothetical protein
MASRVTTVPEVLVMKCLAPLILIASTIQPHAQTCPTFTGPENFTCDTFNELKQRTNDPKFEMSVRARPDGGARSYEVTMRKGTRPFVIGQAIEQAVNGQIYVTTPSCEVFPTQKGPVDAIAVSTQVKGGPVVEKTVLFPQGKGLVRITFKGTTYVRNSCQPILPTHQAPAPSVNTPATTAPVPAIPKPPAAR